MSILVTYLFVSHFLVTIHFSKKHHLLIAQNIYKALFVNVIIMKEIYGKYQGFVNCSSFWQCQYCFVFKLCKLTTMNQVKKKRKNNFLMHTNKRYMNQPRKHKILIKKKIDKIHKLIVKELKLNVNCHIKTCKNHNLLQV